MSPLRVERYIPEDDTWVHAGDVNLGDPDATLSANNPDGSRDIYLFGVDRINRRGFIRKSIAGIDIDNSQTRVVSSVGFEAVTTLDAAQSYEIETVTDRSQGEIRRIRFTYLAD